MKTYTTVDKSTWGDGPWQKEPDKIQWVDKATDLDCLIVRGPSGALCGYVGVAEGHPAFKKDYHEVDVEVHGGLTFANFCHEPPRDGFERWRTNMLTLQFEAKKYPNGDAAEHWKKAGHLIDDYEGWKKYEEARAICHLPEPGRAKDIWWLGFDCAHAFDAMPKIRAQLASIGARSAILERRETYRTLAYVKKEVRSLAKQLKAIR